MSARTRCMKTPYWNRMGARSADHVRASEAIQEARAFLSEVLARIVLLFRATTWVKDGGPMARKYSKKASKKVERAMHERKRGKLRSGRSGRKVTSRKQAIAIGLSEARRSGAKVPKRRRRKSSTG